MQFAPKVSTYKQRQEITLKLVKKKQDDLVKKHSGKYRI